MAMLGRLWVFGQGLTSGLLTVALPKDRGVTADPPSGSSWAAGSLIALALLRGHLGEMTLPLWHDRRSRLDRHAPDPLWISEMKHKHLVLLAAPFLFTQCVVVEGDPNETTAAASSSTAFGQPLTAKTSQGRISIMEGSKPVAFIVPASPNVEETKFINEQQQIVVKSRGNHGPATVQLFDSQTGRQEGKVMAYEIQNGQPVWAAGMGE